MVDPGDIDVDSPAWRTRWHNWRYARNGTRVYCFFSSATGTLRTGMFIGVGMDDIATVVWDPSPPNPKWVKKYEQSQDESDIPRLEYIDNPDVRLRPIPKARTGWRALLLRVAPAHMRWERVRDPADPSPSVDSTEKP